MLSTDFSHNKLILISNGFIERCYLIAAFESTSTICNDCAVRNLQKKIESVLRLFYLNVEKQYKGIYGNFFYKEIIQFQIVLGPIPFI